MRYISNMKVLNKIKIEIRICINNRLINKKNPRYLGNSFSVAQTTNKNIDQQLLGDRWYVSVDVCMNMSILGWYKYKYIKNSYFNLCPGHGTKPAFKQCNIKENHLYSTSRPNQWFQNWPTEIGNIVDGAYFEHWSHFFVYCYGYIAVRFYPYISRHCGHCKDITGAIIRLPRLSPQWTCGNTWLSTPRESTNNPKYNLNKTDQNKTMCTFYGVRDTNVMQFWLCITNSCLLYYVITHSGVILWQCHPQYIMYYIALKENQW